MAEKYRSPPIYHNTINFWVVIIDVIVLSNPPSLTLAINSRILAYLGTPLHPPTDNHDHGVLTRIKPRFADGTFVTGMGGYKFRYCRRGDVAHIIISYVLSSEMKCRRKRGNRIGKTKHNIENSRMPAVIPNNNNNT